MDLRLYQAESYKEILLRYFFSDETQRGALSRAAEFLNCQKSYLSKAIKTEVHLTLEHAYLLAQFLGLSQIDSDYFVNLVAMERAGDKSYREFLEQKLFKLKLDHEQSLNAANRIQVMEFSPNDAIYFSSWHWMAIHFLTACAQYQNIPAISSRLGLSQDFVEKILKQLSQWGFVKNELGLWSYVSGGVHLHAASPFTNMNHYQWRTRAIQDAYFSTLDNINSIHFTNVQTVSLKDFHQAKSLLLNTMAQIRELFNPSPADDLAVLTLDLFFA